MAKPKRYTSALEAAAAKNKKALDEMFEKAEQGEIIRLF